MQYYYENKPKEDTTSISLLTAAMNGQLHAVKELLRNGANIDAQGAHQETALHWAAARGDTQMVDALLQYGAATSNCDQSMNTPVEVAAYFGHPELAKKLHQRRSEEPFKHDEIAERRRQSTPSSGLGE